MVNILFWFQLYVVCIFALVVGVCFGYLIHFSIEFFYFIYFLNFDMSKSLMLRLSKYTETKLNV